MNTLRRFALLGLVLASGLILPPTSTLDAQSVQPWIPVFDESPFAAVETIGKDSIEDHWVVTPEGWVQLARPGGGTLLTKHQFRDFELSFFWKIGANGNNGIKYRVAKLGNQWLGLEYQLLDDTMRDGSTRPKHRTAAIYDILPPAEDKHLNQPGQWNHSRILVQGQRLEHWLNGQPVVVTKSATPDWREAVSKSKFKPHEKFGERRRGHIMFTDHGNPIWLRDVMIRELGKPTLKTPTLQ